MPQSVLSYQETTETQDAKVEMAAHAFAQALAESPEFQAFEQATERLRQDRTAQEAILAYQKKQQSLQMMLRLNAVSPQDQAELERLQQEFLSQPSVADYLQTQETLICSVRLLPINYQIRSD